MSWRRRNRRLSRDPAGKRFLPRRIAELLGHLPLAGNRCLWLTKGWGFYLDSVKAEEYACRSLNRYLFN